MNTRVRLPAWIAVLALLAGCAGAAPTSAPATPKLDVVWVPSPPEVITAMLEAARVGPSDLVYDLGCGEGEILIEAARRYGARGVEDRLTFVQQDLFTTDVRPATVVTLYLLPELNERLRPTLLSDLRPGTPVVSHDFGMGDWTPERTIEVKLARIHRVFLWRIPQRP